MKVIIRSIKIAQDYVDSKRVDRNDTRDVECRVLDIYERDAQFRLPAIEVDGLIVVGGIYELMFARRES